VGTVKKIRRQLRKRHEEDIHNGIWLNWVK
jgi:hypothetical protein